MTSTICFLFFFAIATIATAAFLKQRTAAISLAIGLLLSVAIAPSAIALPYPSNIAALGTPDSAIDQPQQALEETLKVDPTGDHYKGIEYSSKRVQSQPSDEVILEEIETQLSDDIAVAVSNGSVRLSGMVSSRAAAEGLIEQIKDISGVREVAFDLGLAKTESEILRN